MNKTIAAKRARRPSEWGTPRSYLVRRDTPYRLSAGLAWCGPLARGVIGPYHPPFLVSAALWPEAVGATMCGVVIVSAVLARMHPESVFAWPRMFDSLDRELRCRRPSMQGMPKGAAIGVTAKSSRQGEVLVWPVRKQPRHDV